VAQGSCLRVPVKNHDGAVLVCCNIYILAVRGNSDSLRLKEAVNLSPLSSVFEGLAEYNVPCIRVSVEDRNVIVGVPCCYNGFSVRRNGNISCAREAVDIAVSVEKRSRVGQRSCIGIPVEYCDRIIEISRYVYVLSVRRDCNSACAVQPVIIQPILKR
jgi:hypothetical protein